MLRSNVIRLLATASTLFTIPAVAQTRYCMGGDLDHLSQTQRAACSAKVQAVKATATALRAPDNWHFVVVCGEDGWKSYAEYSMEGGLALLSASADTHLERRETFLRGDRLDLDHLRSLRSVVAHEIAGITLRTTDEVAINQQMQLLLSAPGASAGI